MRRHETLLSSRHEHGAPEHVPGVQICKHPTGGREVVDRDVRATPAASASASARARSPRVPPKGVHHRDLAIGRTAGSHPRGDRQPAAAARDDDPAAALGDLRGEVEALLRADEVEDGVDLATGVRREASSAAPGPAAMPSSAPMSRRARSTSTASTRTSDVARSSCTAR
jgi:hypothetical protein